MIATTTKTLKDELVYSVNCPIVITTKCIMMILHTL